VLTTLAEANFGDGSDEERKIADNAIKLNPPTIAITSLRFGRFLSAATIKPTLPINTIKIPSKNIESHIEVRSV